MKTPPMWVRIRSLLLIPLLALASASPGQVWKVPQPGDPRAAPFAATLGRADPRLRVLPKAPAQLPSRRHALTGEAFLTEARLPALDHPTLLREDAANSHAYKRLRNGIRRDVRVRLDDGAWQAVGDSGRLWTVAVVSEGATSLRLHLSGVNLPPGGQIWLWSPEAPDLVDGPFERAGPFGNGRFWSTILPGERVYVEYLSPRGAPSGPPSPLEIDGVIHLYRDFFATIDHPREGDCHNDSSCYPEWAEVRNAVARFAFIDDGASYLCTGQLLDTEAGDLTPYFLTANHCCNSPAIAQTLVTYWFYQSDSCDGPVPSLASCPTSSVADLLSNSASSDYALLLIRGELPMGLFWSGWTSEPIPWSEPSTSIHHPDGAFKRISFGVRGPDLGDFWRIDWTDGPTEPGSSGAGIWRDDPQQLYGQLCCGDSACGHETYDDYGKFSVAFPDMASFLAGGSDDDLEDNDSCVGAVAIGAGTWSDRVVKIFDEDWYAISVPGCANLEVTVSFVDTYGDVDLQLYDECGGSLVASSTSTDNAEAVSVPASDVARGFLLRVFPASDTRNTYDLTVAIMGVGSVILG